MGFGSYDESEQRDPDVSTDADETLDVHDSDYDGDVEFDGASTDEMMAQLDDIMSEADEE